MQEKHNYYYDDLLNLSVLRSYSNKYGVQFTLMQHSIESVKTFNKCSSSLYFIDLNMPVMDGYECASNLRKLGGDSLTLIALTGEEKNTVEYKCRCSGFNEIIEKPISYDAFCGLIEKYK